jgi:hypothetical protein
MVVRTLVPISMQAKMAIHRRVVEPGNLRARRRDAIPQIRAKAMIAMETRSEQDQP